MMLVLRQQTRLERKMDAYFENAGQLNSDRISILPITTDAEYLQFVEKLKDEGFKSKVVS